MVVGLLNCARLKVTSFASSLDLVAHQGGAMEEEEQSGSSRMGQS